jgi:hypothetical protein
LQKRRKFFNSQRPALKTANAARTSAEHAIALISLLDHRWCHIFSLNQTMHGTECSQIVRSQNIFLIEHFRDAPSRLLQAPLICPATAVIPI